MKHLPETTGASYALRGKALVYERLTMRKLAAAALATTILATAAFAADENEIGAKTAISPDNLPKAHATPAVANISHTIARPVGAAPQAPPGFTVTAFATGLTSPRWMAVAPNGDVFLTEPR